MADIPNPSKYSNATRNNNGGSKRPHSPRQHAAAPNYSASDNKSNVLPWLIVGGGTLAIFGFPFIGGAIALGSIFALTTQ